MHKKISQWANKYRWVLIFAVLAAMAAGFFNWQKQGGYIVSLTATVSRYGTQNAADYKYDNYYALKATDEFGNTVAAWFKTPEMAQTIAKKIGASVEGRSLSSLSRQYKAAKISPNLVEIRFSAASEAEGRKVAQAISQILQEKADFINASSWQGISFSVLAGEPVVIKDTANFWLIVLAGFLVGLATGLFFQATKEYLK